MCSRIGSKWVHIFPLLKTGLPADRVLRNLNGFTQNLANATANPDYYAVCNLFLAQISPPLMSPGNYQRPNYVKSPRNFSL